MTPSHNKTVSLLVHLYSDSNVILTNHASRQRGNTMFKENITGYDITLNNDYDIKNINPLHIIKEHHFIFYDTGYGTRGLLRRP